MAKLWLALVVMLLWAVGARHGSSAQSAPSPTPHPSATPRSIPTPSSSSVSTSDWKYPNSTSTGDNKWQSNDGPQVITNWYKSRIEALHLNAQSFVQTDTNDNVLNKLVAGSGAFKVSVEISKSSTFSQTSISVVLDK